MQTEQTTVPYINKVDNIILFDGECPLCNKWCQFIIKYDTHHVFKLASMQSEKGQDILKHLKLPTENFETLLLIEGNTIYKKSTAFIKAVTPLPFPIKLLCLLKYTPKLLRDYIYDRIAQNRFKLFRRFNKNECMLPTADHNKRYL